MFCDTCFTVLVGVSSVRLGCAGQAEIVMRVSRFSRLQRVFRMGCGSVCEVILTIDSLT